MVKAFKMLRLVQFAMLASVALYWVVGEVVKPVVRPLDPTLSYLLTTLGVALVGTIFVVRRTLVLRAAESLATNPEDELTVGHWRTGYIATYVLCETLALFGLIQRFLGGAPAQSVPYYLGGFVLLWFFRPKLPARV